MFASDSNEMDVQLQGLQCVEERILSATSPKLVVFEDAHGRECSAVRRKAGAAGQDSTTETVLRTGGQRRSADNR